MPTPGHNPHAPLTEKQQKFIEAYALHQNATRAAIEAGYAKSGANHMSLITGRISDAPTINP